MTLIFKVADKLSPGEEALGVLRWAPVYADSFTSHQYFEHIHGTHQAQQTLLTPGEVGCTLAHLGIYREAVARDAAALIFEADIEVTESLLSRAKKVLKVYGEVDFIHLGIHPHRSFFGKRPRSSVAVADPRYFLYGTFAYYISPHAAQHLLDFHDRRLRRADSWQEFFSEHDIVPHYYPLVRHPDERGSIDTERDLARLEHPLSLMLLANQLSQLVRRKLMTLYRLVALVPLTEERCCLAEDRDGDSNQPPRH